MKIDFKPSILKVSVSVLGSLFLVYIVSAFFCTSPPCFSKKNEFLLTVFMSEQTWFFMGLWILFMIVVYIIWSWWQGRGVNENAED